MNLLFYLNFQIKKMMKLKQDEMKTRCNNYYFQNTARAIATFSMTRLRRGSHSVAGQCKMFLQTWTYTCFTATMPRCYRQSSHLRERPRCGAVTGGVDLEIMILSPARPRDRSDDDAKNRRHTFPCLKLSNPLRVKNGKSK